MSKEREFRHWNRLYWMQVVVLALLIALFYWLTRAFS